MFYTTVTAKDKLYPCFKKKNTFKRFLQNVSNSKGKIWYNYSIEAMLALNCG